MNKSSFNGIIQKQWLEIIHEVIVIVFFSCEKDEVDLDNNLHFLFIYLVLNQDLCQQEVALFGLYLSLTLKLT